MELPISIKTLQNNLPLYYKVLLLIYDLRHFEEKADCQARLDSVVDISYISLPYFDQAEAHILKTALLSSDEKDSRTLEDFLRTTLDERLNRRMKKRVDSGDFRVCAAHDIAPIWEEALGIKSKELAKNREFVAYVNANGLEGANEWQGLGKVGKAKVTKKGKRV
ncbi:MAG: hypothetical protein M1817_005374 [Caeruleum heppii]|nr:MAG: hypothetical protein M1817_005374 [Caeruleum heppii]